AGTNFGATQGTSSVKFNGTTAAVTAWSATSIVATVPSAATTGNVVVRVSNLDSNGSAFTVLPTPTITNLSPAAGAARTAADHLRRRLWRDARCEHRDLQRCRGDVDHELGIDADHRDRPDWRGDRAGGCDRERRAEHGRAVHGARHPDVGYAGYRACRRIRDH